MAGALITLTDVCSNRPFQMYIKNIVEIQYRFVVDASDGTPHEKEAGSIVRSRPGNYIDEVVETPQQITQMVIDAGGTVTLF
jgi:hypothetical protein